MADYFTHAAGKIVSLSYFFFGTIYSSFLSFCARKKNDEVYGNEISKGIFLSLRAGVIERGPLKEQFFIRILRHGERASKREKLSSENKV